MQLKGTIKRAGPERLRVERLFSLRGRIALVTGAAGGFGSAVALGFAQAGADLVITDIDASGLKRLASDLKPLKRRILTCELDVMKESEVQSVVAKVKKQFGRIDVLIHIAGLARLAPVTKMSTKDFDFTISSHLRGTFFLTRAVGSLMIQQDGGSIVLMSSIASQCALGRGTGAYAAAKAGVNALVRELAVEWAPQHIRINAVAPCQFRTAGLRDNLNNPKFNPAGDMEQKMISAIPANRLGEPHEIVGPCLFLASDAASMVTGHVLFVDGGYTAR
jgi:NAD(P)-dependent dehydrogenase (short-subunit alcohol dehydrogenase family)